jgi:uncharacterized protein (TIGR02996 family)
VASRDAFDPELPAEQQFLEHLRRNPADAAMRMVFADWLEKTGQGDKAQIVRMFEDANRAYSRAMRKATRKVAPGWLAVVSRTPIEECGIQWKLKCPKSWSALATTEDDRVRHCDTCQRNVYFCATLDEVRERGAASQCVAFAPQLERDQAIGAYRIRKDGGWSELELGEVAVSPSRRR